MREPKITYNDGTSRIREFLLSQDPWMPASIGVGGHRRAMSGVAESRENRRDELLRVRLRFYESEWFSVHYWLRWAQRTSGQFNFYFDKDLPSFRTCDLYAPIMGEDISPVRGSYPGTLELDITIRAIDGAPFTEAFY